MAAAGAYFEHDGAKIYYLIENTGPPILLIHGWTCDIHDWVFQIPLLHSLGFQTIAFDIRGHGRSSTPPDDAILSPELYADDAAALLDHLKIDAAIVMSHSLGTIFASALAVRRPEIVKALVLVDPVYNSFGKAMEDLTAWMSSPYSPSNAGDFFALLCYSDSTPEWMKAWHRRRALGVPQKVVTGLIQQVWGIETSIGRWETAKTYMKQRTCPRLVTAFDKPKVDAENELGVDEGRGDRVEIIEGGGHWHHQQNSEWYNALLRKWLEDCSLLPK